MGKENGRGKSRRRNISQARKFLNREGKKLCSAALCVSLLFGSVLNTTVAANKDTDDDGYEFELSRASLYQALQDAVLNGDTVDEDMEFRGSAAEEYSEMFAPSGSLYELKPEIEDNDGKVQLRVFAKLDQDIDLDSEYEAAGTEEIMFLLTNRSDEAQKAVIYMDDKYTEEIEVAPGKAIAVQEDETSQGPAGGGSSSGGSAAGGETPADTETTGPADEGGQAPDNGGAPTESQPEETTGTEDKDDATTPDGATDPTESDDNVTDGNGETGDSADDKTDDSATSDNDNSTSVEDGDKENSGNGGDTENTGDTNADSDNTGNENQSGGQTGTVEGGSENTGDTENGGGSTENSDGGNSSTGGDSTTSDGGSGSNGGDENDGSDNSGSDSGTTTAAISFHKASWVAAPVATDSDMPVATGSDLATNSDLEKLIDGELYEAVRLRENGAVAFVTTLDDLGVMDGWGPIVFGQKFEADCGNFHVRAIARKGALDNAYMEVTSIDPETNPEEYEKAAQSLAEAGKQYEGMAALDITFRDKDTGEEVEPWSDSENPADWPVYVTIEFLENALPEDINLDTVEVQHLKETKVEGSQEEVQIDVEEVADAGGNTDGIVAPANLVDTELVEVSAKAEAVAAFTVSDFSYFTITWGYRNGKELNVYLIDGNANGIPGGNSDHYEKYDITISQNESVEIQNQAPYVKNYKYLRAVIADDASAAVQNGAKTILYLQCSDERIQYATEREWIGGIYLGYWKYNWTNLGNKNVYLIYSKDNLSGGSEGGGDVTTQPPNPEYSKTAVSNNDGTYDLTLSVTGSIGSQNNTVNVDVLMVVDTSGSMEDDEESFWNPNPTKRMTNLKAAMKTLVNTLNGKNGVDAQYSIVSFASSGSEVLGWTKIPKDVDVTDTIIGEKISGLTADGGTNYMAGLKLAKERLEESYNNKDRKAYTVVVFLSDGQPTYYDGGGDGSSALGLGKGGWRATVEIADDIVCNRFYSIGIGTTTEAYMNTNAQYKNGLIDVVNAPDGYKEYKAANETGSNLTTIFGDIAGSVTSLFIKDVTIIDPLNTTYVEPVVNQDLSVHITDGDGNEVTDADELRDAGLTPSYENGILKLDFNPGYTLQNGYTYSVTMKIQPTQAAIEYYAQYGTYPDTPTPDVYTGTHTGQMGFYSNLSTNDSKALLTYHNTNEDSDDPLHEIEYPMPVVQLTVGNLVIEKKVEGLTGDSTALQDLQNNLKFEVVKKGETRPVKTIPYTEFDANGKYTVSGLVPGKYTVRESGSTIPGYECTATTSPTTPEVTVTKGGTTNITFTNRYTKLYSLTVKKLLDGDMVETDKEFEFTATVDGDPYTTGEGFDQDGHFFLAGNEQISLTGLLAGSQVIIEEIGYNGYRTSIGVEDGGTANTHTSIIGTSNRKYNTGTGGLTADTTVIFTNYKNSTDDVPLTGIFTDKLPYLLMFSIAMICTAGAMFNSSVRRRHGRDEE